MKPKSFIVIGNQTHGNHKVVRLVTAHRPEQAEKHFIATFPAITRSTVRSYPYSKQSSHAISPTGPIPHIGRA